MTESLTIGTDLGELRRMSAWLRAVAATAALAPDDAHALELCANEAIANIVQHGQPSRAAMPIELRFSADERGFALRVEDRAGAFDPMAAALPPAPCSLEEARIGGLGVLLIQRLLPETRYQRDGEFNVLMLRGSRAAPA